MKTENDKFSPVSFVQDKRSGNASSVTYVGPGNTKEFLIKEVLANTGVIEKYTYFNFTIKFERMYTDQLISTFFPTILLWMLAYFTIFIKPENFNERMMVSVTVLLVLAALLAPIRSEIPPTSYFKYIDLWFLWYTAYIFSITIFHIILHEATTKIESNKVAIGTQIVKIGRQHEKSRKDVINDTAKVLILIPFILFNCIYFFIQFST